MDLLSCVCGSVLVCASFTVYECVDMCKCLGVCAYVCECVTHSYSFKAISEPCLSLWFMVTHFSHTTREHARCPKTI